MPTNEYEGTADREWRDPKRRDLILDDYADPVLGAWLFIIAGVLAVGVMIDLVVRWIA